MGQATVDLPDPLEQPPASSPANTDDLLAQLAGEEIDRLLAEADAEAAPPAAAAEPQLIAPVLPPPPEPPTPATDAASAEAPAVVPAPQMIAAEPTAVELPGPPDVPARPAAVEVPLPPAAAEQALDAAVAAQLGDAIGAADQPVTAAVPLPPATQSPPPPSPLEVAAAARDVDEAIAAAAPAVVDEHEAKLEAVAPAASEVQNSPAEPVDPEASTSAAERGGLNAAQPDAAMAELQAEFLEDDRPLPFWLKPLEWLNAPIDLLPETLRDIIGKIALLTLFNAVAVFIYVLFIRKHG